MSAGSAAGSDQRLITLAILAMGGEGGGVLADWLVDLAEHNGHVAQTTSVPGVAQRTGATIYYLEMFPADQVPAGQAPVMALSPFPGAVDLVIASELMEAGRALQRQLVTPERTTLIASTHRVYSMTERTAVADGRVDAGKLLEGARAASACWIGADFSQLAEQCGTPVGATLFGAIAASGRLPFGRSQFEQTIERSGVGVQASLKAFALGWQAAQEALKPPAQSQADTASEPALPKVGPRLSALAQRACQQLPAPAKAHALHGLMRLADYQDLAYAELYLDRLQSLCEVAPAAAPAQQALAEAARHLALWMSYEDTVRVADLKTRRSRFERVGQEVRLGPQQGLHINEFLHPRLEEIADTLPAAWGRWLLRTGWARKLVGRYASSGRVVRTSSLRGFLLLYGVASLRRWRPKSLRFETEQQRIGAWLADLRRLLPAEPELALELARAQRLVKGYGDTHARGWRHFEMIVQQLPAMAGQAGAAVRLQTLVSAALADDSGQALRSALKAH
jgi:indolepyruvate ferredoxin oxidoreductase beta subunit